MSNWCMCCGREIPNGDFCPSCVARIDATPMHEPGPALPLADGPEVWTDMTAAQRMEDADDYGAWLLSLEGSVPEELEGNDIPF